MEGSLMGRGRDRIKRRKAALAKVADIVNQPELVMVIHYSCQSFIDRADGSSARITSIAVKHLASGQTHSFSIHQLAEKQFLQLDVLEPRYPQLERQMLEDFYTYVGQHQNHTWVHWNMTKSFFGFEALAHRLAVAQRQTSGQPAEVSPVNIPDEKRLDLGHLMGVIYGPQYIGDPHMAKLVEKNKLGHPHFLLGKDEAQAFENKEYVKLHLSTLRKVDVISIIAEMAYNGSLATDATLKDKYGSYGEAVAEFLKEGWWIFIIFTILSVVANILQITGAFSSK
jgi:hypothetical protein